MVRESAIELDCESGTIRLALADRESVRVRIDPDDIGRGMQLFDQDRHRSSTASDIEHAKSGFDLRLFDQPSLCRISSEQPQKRIVERQQPAFSKRGNKT